MKILGVKFDPTQQQFVEFPAPMEAVALSVVIPTTAMNLLGLAPVDLNPMVMVGIEDTEGETGTMYVQIVTTGESIEGSKYIDSFWWNQGLFHLFWGFK